MIGLARTDYGIFSDWWWTIDRILLVLLTMLIMVGYVMIFAASPAIAQKLGIAIYHFAYKQLVFLFLGVAIMFILSLLPPRKIYWLAFIGFITMLSFMGLVLLSGDEVKGAQRWIRIAGFSLQPSEIVKPCFILLCACLFARFGARGVFASLLLLIPLGALLIMQPDIGQLLLVCFVWGCMVFLIGGSLITLGALSAIAMIGFGFLYHFMPHIRFRIDRFIDPSSGSHYQVEKAMEALSHGGLRGTGLGDGQIKWTLPDAHTDFVFAVAAEEGGFLLGAVILAIFLAIILRVFYRLRSEKIYEIQLATGGLITLFGIQAMINLAVNLNLLPPKGMTLPFLSYGGSSMLGISLTMGMILAFTRRRIGKNTTPKQNAPKNRKGGDVI
ncbi:MAG: FtsW/RodA/SpoVE family cell cycle protein [Parvibaculales bacterium]